MDRMLMCTPYERVLAALVLDTKLNLRFVRTGSVAEGARVALVNVGALLERAAALGHRARVGCRRALDRGPRPARHGAAAEGSLACRAMIPAWCPRSIPRSAACASSRARTCPSCRRCSNAAATTSRCTGAPAGARRGRDRLGPHAPGQAARGEAVLRPLRARPRRGRRRAARLAATRHVDDRAASARPAVRGRGAGTQIVEAVDAWAAAAGADTLRVVVKLVNPGALAFWQALGFRDAPLDYEGLVALERPLRTIV